MSNDNFCKWRMTAILIQCWHSKPPGLSITALPTSVVATTLTFSRHLMLCPYSSWLRPTRGYFQAAAWSVLWSVATATDPEQRLHHLPRFHWSKSQEIPKISNISQSQSSKKWLQNSSVHANFQRENIAPKSLKKICHSIMSVVYII